jgi:hypothetical protein
MNMVTTGTVMPSRKDMPEPLNKNRTGNLRQWHVLSSTKNVKLVDCWRYKCTVMILSTFHSGSKNEVTEVL